MSGVPKREKESQYIDFGQKRVDGERADHRPQRQEDADADEGQEEPVRGVFEDSVFHTVTS